MCGRYQLDEDMKEIIERFDLEKIFEDSKRKIGEIFPSDFSPVIYSNDKEMVSNNLKWGIKFPFLMHDIINARIESLYSKKMYDDGITNGRCLIPANYFYEWEKIFDNKKVKRKILIPDQSILAFAGIKMYSQHKETGEKIDTFVILTQPAYDEVLKIHDRMPVILRRDDEKKWLDIDLDKTDVQKIISRSQKRIKIA